MTQWRYQAGLSDELAVQQAGYNLENTRSQIPTLRTGLEEAMNRIAVLLGEQPGKVHDGIGKTRAHTGRALERSPWACRPTLLRRRPDVRRAERELAAQTARIGVATADLYPKFTLTGSIGLETLSLGNLSSGSLDFKRRPRDLPGRSFKPGPSARTSRRSRPSRSSTCSPMKRPCSAPWKRLKMLSWPMPRSNSGEQSLSEAAQAAQKAVGLARQKYQAGLTDFSNVLDAQRSLFLSRTNWPKARNRNLQPGPPLQGPRRRMDIPGLDERNLLT